MSRMDGQQRKMVSCYARDDRIFSFGVALCGRKLTERLRLSNPGKVPCTVALKILPRADGNDAKRCLGGQRSLAKPPISMRGLSAGPSRRPSREGRPRPRSWTDAR